MQIVGFMHYKQFYIRHKTHFYNELSKYTLGSKIFFKSKILKKFIIYIQFGSVEQFEMH